MTASKDRQVVHPEGRTQITKEHENDLDYATALHLGDAAHDMVCVGNQNSRVCSPRISGFIMWSLHTLPKNGYILCIS